MKIANDIAERLAVCMNPALYYNPRTDRVYCDSQLSPHDDEELLIAKLDYAGHPLEETPEDFEEIIAEYGNDWIEWARQRQGAQ